MILALSSSPASLAGWLGGGILLGLLLIAAALRFGLIGLLVVFAVMMAVGAAILSTI